MSISNLFVLPFSAALLLITPAVGGVTEQPSADPFKLKMLAPGVYGAVDGPEGKSGSNAGFVIGDDGVLVVDSFFDPAATRALIADVHRLTTKPIRYVVNTHYHVDHVGGDSVLRDAGAIIIAHRNVRGWIRTENLHLLGDRISAENAKMIRALPLPDVTIEKDVTVWLGARRVLIRPVRGHTGGDLVVTVPDAKVIFCGDILWNHVSPNIIDGDVASWTSTVVSLERESAAGGTTFLPGHGEVASARDLASFGRYLGDLRALVVRERAAGRSGKALIADALPKFSAQHGDWAAFGYFAPLELGFMDDELAGTKRRPQPDPA